MCVTRPYRIGLQTLLLASLVGCGMRGPLVLPERARPVEVQPAPASQPVAETPEELADKKKAAAPTP